MSKGTDLRAYTCAHLDEIERKLNGRHRKTLEWLKPCENLTDLICSERLLTLPSIL